MLCAGQVVVVAVVNTVVVRVAGQKVFVTLTALLGPETLSTAALFGLLLLSLVPVTLLYSVHVKPSVPPPTQDAYWSHMAMQFWMVAGPVERMPAG